MESEHFWTLYEGGNKSTSRYPNPFILPPLSRAFIISLVAQRVIRYFYGRLLPTA